MAPSTQLINNLIHQKIFIFFIFHFSFIIYYFNPGYIISQTLQNEIEKLLLYKMDWHKKNVIPRLPAALFFQKNKKNGTGKYYVDVCIS